MAPHDPNMVAALKRERTLYASRGQNDRVAQVDEQLAYYGEQEPEQPEGRTGQDPSQQTAAPASGGILHDGPPLVGETGPETEPPGEATPEDDKPRRGRPRKPRDDAGNIIRE